jgi:hypothetical protein
MCPLLFFIGLVWKAQNTIRLYKEAFVDIENHLGLLKAVNAGKIMYYTKNSCPR